MNFASVDADMTNMKTAIVLSVVILHLKQRKEVLKVNIMNQLVMSLMEPVIAKTPKKLMGRN